MSSPESSHISRRDFLKLTSSAAVAVLLSSVPLDSASGLEMLSSPNPPKEELPGGMDITLSFDEIQQFENNWREVEGVREFESLEDYLAKFCILLNATRARSLKGEAFIETVQNFIGEGANIQGKSLALVEEIQRLIPDFSKVRDLALEGKTSTSEYSLWTVKLLQSISFSYLCDRYYDVIYTNDCIGETELAYTQFVPGSVSEFKEDFTSPGRTDFHIVPESGMGQLAKSLFDISSPEPVKGLVQRKLEKLTDLAFGDLIFRDVSTGYRRGHPLVVTRVDRDQKGELSTDGIGIFDGNVDGRMVAGIFIIDNRKTFDSVFQTGRQKIGILRTELVDDDLYLNKLHLSSVLAPNQLPVEIVTGRQEIFPDFSQIKIFSEQWNKFDSNKRSEAINNIVNMVGLHVRDVKGNIVIGPRWTSNFGNNFWLCNVYSTILLQALGIKDVGHWYLNNKPAKNEGEEYDVAKMFKWMNSFGRENNWLDVTNISEEDRLKLLELGYVMFGASRGHTWTILPMTNSEGKTVPALSQAGFDYPLRAPNFSYKFKRPRANEEFSDYPQPGYQLAQTDGILWAHILPGVKEIKHPFRAPLFGANFQYNTDVATMITHTGWLTTVDDLKKYVSDIDPSSLEGMVDKLFRPQAEKLPTGNHLFQYAFDVVKIIQQYRLPTGISSDQDTEYFMAYFKKSMIDAGYKKIIENPYAEAVFNNIRSKFITREMSYKLQEPKPPIQPIKCFGLLQLLDMGRGIIDWAPARAGGISSGNAQEVANTLLNQTYTINGESVVDKNTVAVHFPGDVPPNLNSFKAGDSFHIAYSGDSEGHVGVILTDPFIDKSGNTVVAVADSNRINMAREGGVQVNADGMPRIRIMTYQNFVQTYLLNKDLIVNGKLVVLRPKNKR